MKYRRCNTSNRQSSTAYSRNTRTKARRVRIWHASYYVMNRKECAQNDLYLQLRIGGMDIVLGEGAEAIIFIYRERRYRESRPCAAFLLRHCLVRWLVARD